MAAASSARDSDPTLVQQILDLQRDHWRRGERVLVETLLENHPTLADDRERLLDLIGNEVDLRAAHGETPRLDEYRGRFPALSDDLGRRFAALQPSSKTLESRDAHSDRTATGDSALSGGVPIPPPTTLPPPDIEGYEVLGLLGKGGMGIVYQARQKAAGRVVALKMILGGFADPETRARFRTEGRAVASLQHPNVVQVFEVGEHRGAPYFSLEFCGGGGLDRKLGGTPLPAAEAARLMETLARAVQHAHEKGVVHRDLKPANVLLAADGTPKVTDFGLAKLGAGSPGAHDGIGLTQTGAVLGSPPYMAPEQAAGQSREIGPATDVYALGAILYECLTGRPPFRAATLLDTLVQVRHDDPVPPRQLQSKTPRDLETVCLKCLQKDPKKRYSSAAALAEDLRRYQAGEPIAARPVGAWERAAKWVRRRPAVAALILLSATFLLAGAAVSTWFAVVANHRADLLAKEQDNTKAALKQKGTALDQVTEVNKRLEEAVARGLLRPLGHQAGAVADPEIEALWELAGSTDRVRLLLVERALQRPATTRQLRNRADLAVHAAVGLDPARRRKVEALLLGRLRDEECDPGLRTDCVFIGLALGDWSPEFAAAAVRQALQAMRKTSDPSVMASLAQATAALAPRLAPAEAARQTAAAADLAVEAMGKTDDRVGLAALAQAVADLAPRMAPDEAARQTTAAARRVLDAMTKTEDPFTLEQWAGAVAALAPRLDPGEASAAARQVLTLTTKTTDLTAQVALARTVLDLAPWLAPDEAGGFTAAVVAPVVDAMGKTAATVDAMGNSTDPVTLEKLAVVVERAAPRLAPEQAAAAANVTVMALERTTEPSVLAALVRAEKALSPRLEPELCTAFAQLALIAMARTTDPSTLAALAQAVGTLTPEQDPAEAVRQTPAATRRALEALGKTTNPVALEHLAWAVADLAPRLPPGEAAGAVHLTVDALEKTTDPFAVAALARTVAALAPRLEPDKAARQTGAAAHRVVEAMGKTTEPKGLAALARAAEALIVRVDVKDAAPRISSLGAAAGAADLLGGLGLLAEASRPLPGRFTDQELVDLLKTPTCRQPARQVIVRQLAGQCGRPFADEWEFVDWAGEHRPDLDLASPPVGPDHPSGGD